MVGGHHHKCVQNNWKCRENRTLTTSSGTRRDLQLRSIRIRPRYPRDSPRRPLRAHRRCSGRILFRRTTRYSRQNWLRDMSDRIRHHRSPCSTGRGGRVGGQDSAPCNSARYGSLSPMLVRDANSHVQASSSTVYLSPSSPSS